MVDGMRIAVRTAAIAGLIIAAVAIYALFAKVQVPAADVSQLVQVVGMGKALVNHWAPEVMWMITAVVALYTARWSVFLARYAVMGVKWLLAIWR